MATTYTPMMLCIPAVQHIPAQTGAQPWPLSFQHRWPQKPAMFAERRRTLLEISTIYTIRSCDSSSTIAITVLSMVRAIWHARARATTLRLSLSLSRRSRQQPTPSKVFHTIALICPLLDSNQCACLSFHHFSSILKYGNQHSARK